MVFAIPFGNYLDLDAGIRCAKSLLSSITITEVP